MLTSVDRAVANGTYTVAQVAPATTISLGAGGGLRGLGVAAAISVSGTLAPTSLSMFNLSSVVTPSARTDLKSVEVYKSNPQINGLPGVADGVSGSTFSSFQHQLRLQADRPAAPLRSRGSTASTCRRRQLGRRRVDRPELLGGQDRGAGRRGDDHAADRDRHPGLQGPRRMNYSLRSFGKAVHMRHSGGVSLGAQATPDTLLHLHGNASAHGSLTVESESANPPAPDAGTRRLACTSRRASS